MVTRDEVRIGMKYFLRGLLEEKTRRKPVCEDPFNQKNKQQEYCFFGNRNKEEAMNCPFFYIRKSFIADGCNYNRYVDSE